jgi:hypothetical protein
MFTIPLFRGFYSYPMTDSLMIFDVDLGQMSACFMPGPIILSDAVEL